MPTKVIFLLDNQEATLSELKMVKAIQEAMLQFPVASTTPTALTPTWVAPKGSEDVLYCPLSFNLGDFEFSGRTLFKMCQEVSQLRQQVQKWGYLVGEGNYYLPVVHTAKGSLYAEVIGQDEQGQYQQPFSLPDAQRQPLYYFAHRLLTHLNAFPSVYLVQFGWETEKLVFDRLYPFPTEVALASLDVQQPNLFECYWQCLTGQAILDLTVLP